MLLGGIKPIFIIKSYIKKDEIEQSILRFFFLDLTVTKQVTKRPHTTTLFGAGEVCGVCASALSNLTFNGFSFANKKKEVRPLKSLILDLFYNLFSHFRYVMTHLSVILEYHIWKKYIKIFFSVTSYPPCQSGIWKKSTLKNF